MITKKICLYCGKDWDVCQGFECQCWDGACCDEVFDIKNNMKYKSYWYKKTI